MSTWGDSPPSDPEAAVEADDREEYEAAEASLSRQGREWQRVSAVIRELGGIDGAGRWDRHDVPADLWRRPGSSGVPADELGLALVSAGLEHRYADLPGDELLTELWSMWTAEQASRKLVVSGDPVQASGEAVQPAPTEEPTEADAGAAALAAGAAALAAWGAAEGFDREPPRPLDPEEVAALRKAQRPAVVHRQGRPPGLGRRTQPTREELEEWDALQAAEAAGLVYPDFGSVPERPTATAPTWRPEARGRRRKRRRSAMPNRVYARAEPEAAPKPWEVPVPEWVINVGPRSAAPPAPAPRPVPAPKRRRVLGERAVLLLALVALYVLLAAAVAAALFAGPWLGAVVLSLPAVASVVGPHIVASRRS